MSKMLNRLIAVKTIVSSRLVAKSLNNILVWDPRFWMKSDPRRKRKVQQENIGTNWLKMFASGFEALEW